MLHEFEEGGEEMFTAFHGLWRVLVQVTSHKDIGEIVCILDALDECERKGQVGLLQALSRFYNTKSSKSSLKFLVSSRP